MKKLITLLLFLFLALFNSTYLYYIHWRSEQQASTPVPHIPPSASFVYEVEDFYQQWEQFQFSAIGQELVCLPPLATMKETFQWLKQELIEGPEDLQKVPLIISLHQTPQGGVNCLLYFNTHDLATQKLLAALSSKLQKDPTCSSTTRRYSNHKVTTWSKGGAAPHFSYIKRNQYLVVSPDPTLIEEVAQTVSNMQQESFLKLNRSENNQGALYINLTQISPLLHSILQPQQANDLSHTLVRLAQSTHLYLKMTPRHVLINGTVTTQGPQFLPQTMVGQTPSSIGMAAYLPKCTAILHHVTFSDAELLLTAWQQYANSPADMTNSVALAPLLQEALAYCTLADGRQLLLMKVTNPQAFVSLMSSAKYLAITAPITTKVPQKVYQLKPGSLQHELPGQLFPNFRPKYFTYMGDYVVLADQKTTLETWHSQYRQGNTWSNSVEKKSWLASTLEQAHFTWFVDTVQLWPLILDSLQPAWKQILKKRPMPPQVDASLQLLGHAQGDTYASIVIKHKNANALPSQQSTPLPTKVANVDAETPPKAALFQAEAPLIHAPWLVKSHRSGGHYVFLQDAQHQLHLLLPSGKRLWSKKLEGPITSEVFEVDFYKNNKTQYLFATNKQLHLVDYYGRAVSPYPQALPQAQTHLQVVDYNRDKNYRFLLATPQGDLYLKNKAYQPLPGWNPRRLDGPLVTTPFYNRIQGKDRFLALQADGVLQMLNRRGEHYPGFPLNLNASTHNPLLITLNDQGSALLVLTDAGKLMSINWAGQTEKSVQLKSKTNTSRVILCPNQAIDKSYAIVRQDSGKVAIMDAAAHTLFEVPYSSKELRVQYYGFAHGQNFYVITDPVQQLSCLYDSTGKQLNEHPWQNAHAVRLVMSHQQLKVYTAARSSFRIYTLPLSQ